jgi:membrane protein YdbS with pleckstrin-like domain
LARDAPALAQWQPSYKRALPIQSGLAIAAGLTGIAAWYVSGDWQWFAGSVVMLANRLFTLLVIMPVNKRLLSMQQSEAGTGSRAMLVKRGGLHNIRSALGAGSMAPFLWGFAATSLGLLFHPVCDVAA